MCPEFCSYEENTVFPVVIIIIDINLLSAYRTLCVCLFMWLHIPVPLVCV
jgi:hypothetical protein